MNIDNFVLEILGELNFVVNEEKIEFIKYKTDNLEEPEKSKVINLIELGIAKGPGFLQSKHVVVLIHGIRTHASWQGIVKSELSSHQNIHVYDIGYGYFDGFRFWFPFYTRNKPINTITSKLRRIQEKHPEEPITVIAHSFGTYIVSMILERCSDIKIKRLLLCGSIIQDDYDWVNINCPSSIVNEVGLKDYWPVAAKVSSWGYGCTGSFGFKNPDLRDRYHDLDHSEFFTLRFIRQFWIPYVIKGQLVPSPFDERRPNPPWFISFVSIFPFKTSVLAALATISWVLLTRYL